ncbi:MAG: MSHA biogenesis protein MshP [Alteromonadaceae bacterium]|jgi:MSHA biogenesis protein MshP
MPVISTDTDPMNIINHKQKGSSLVMAIFVIVVLSLLGSALVQVLSTSSEAIAQEVLGTRALAAANSGMQGHLQKIFPLTGGDSCPPITTPLPTYNFSNVKGLYTCSAVVTCEPYITKLNEIAYYRVISTGSCGVGDIEATSFNKSIVISSRTVQVEARRLK